MEAAGRTFRTGGFGGAGVDMVASEAGLTSGAFYAHFGSKANAFRVALVQGLEGLRRAIERFQATHGPGWVAPFVEFYLEDRLHLDLSEACALPTFTPDAARADASTRAAYAEQVAAIAAAVAAGLEGPRAEQRAWALLAILSGGASMARAIPDHAARAPVVEAVKAAAKAI